MIRGAFLLAILTIGQADGVPGVLDDREVERLIQSARQRFERPTTDREDRARFVLDVASRIDQAALAEPTAEGRADRWQRAVGLLDEFAMAEPGNPLLISIKLQAAVYRWAEGHAWSSQFNRSPADQAAKVEAAEALDDAIARFRRLWAETRERNASDQLTQNIRYRFAQALADRAGIEDDPARAADAREQALGRLKELPDEPLMAGLASLLRVRLLTELNLLDLAEEALREAERQSGPSETDWLDTRVALLVARKEFDEAIALIENAELDRPSRDVRAVRVLAKQWKDHGPGPERARIEEDAITRVRRLRDANHPEATAALSTLSATILEPDNRKDIDLWELLAEGHFARGDVEQAVRLNRLGADQAEAEGDRKRAWLMRFRAAAMLVRAGEHAQAAEALGPLAALARDPDSEVPDDQRPSVSLLHALTMGRLASISGDRAPYEEALEAHIAAFPDDQTTGEARWILAQLRFHAGRGDDAIALWSLVPVGHSRWREARMAIVSEYHRAIDAEVFEARFSEARDRLEEARAALEAFREEAQEPTDRNVFDLTRAELELTPVIGSATEALELLDRLVDTEVNQARRVKARQLRIVALAQALRSADATREATAELALSEAEDIIPLAVRLDRVAAQVPEPDRRRVAGITRLLTERVLARSEGMAPALRSQARLIRIRAQLDTGDFEGARSSARTWSADLAPAAQPPELLAPLADALDRLGLYHLAANAHRAVIARHAPGSLPWFEGRYGLAVAYYRSDRPEDARRLIDGTAALHPDLGGEELRQKFHRLRRRLQAP